MAGLKNTGVVGEEDQSNLDQISLVPTTQQIPILVTIGQSDIFFVPNSYDYLY
jgi:hypothetical protein